MNKNWEINKVSTCERVAQKITERMERPVVILNLGPPGPVAADATKGLLDNIHVPMTCASEVLSNGDVSKVAQWMLEYPVSMYSLRSPKMLDRDFRHSCVESFRKAGAKTVVGLFTESSDGVLTGQSMPEGAGDDFTRSVPTADEFDYLITVTKE